MIQTLVFTAAAVILSVTNADSVSECTVDKPKACIENFVTTAGTAKDNKGLPILFKTGATESDFTNLCTAKDNYLNCVNPFIDSCNNKLSLQGIYDAANYSCSTKQMSDYTTNAPCLGGPPNLGYSTMCLDVLNSGLTHDNWCQKVDDYLGCMTKGATINCDQTAADYQHEIMSQLYEAKATNMYNCTLGNRKYYCRPGAAAACYSYFASVAGLQLDQYYVPIPFIPDVTDGSVDKVCTSVEGLNNCISYDVPCSGEDLGKQKTLEGVQDLFKHICDHKDEYKTNSKCLAGDANYKEAKDCSIELNTALTDSVYCSKVAQYYECLNKGANKTCSETAAEYETKIYKILLGPQSERYNCESSSSAVVGSFTVILLAIMILLQLSD